MSREKQIEEMAEIIKETRAEQRTELIKDRYGNVYGQRNVDCREEDIAEALYNADYRKQIEGEWKRQKGRHEAICSECGREVVYQVIDNKWAFENFCPHCGAKMKGGDKA